MDVMSLKRFVSYLNSAYLYILWILNGYKVLKHKLDLKQPLNKQFNKLKFFLLANGLVRGGKRSISNEIEKQNSI